MATVELLGETSEYRPTPTSQRSHRLLVATILGGSLLGVLTLALSIYGLVGSALRWLLLLTLLLLMCVWSVVWVSRRSHRPAPLTWSPALRGGNLWQVHDLMTLLGRARKGMTFSQLVVAQRVRDILLERVRVGRSLDYDEVNALRRDPAALQTLLGDPELTMFVLHIDDGPNMLVARNIPR